MMVVLVGVCSLLCSSAVVSQRKQLVYRYTVSLAGLDWTRWDGMGWRGDEAGLGWTLGGLCGAIYAIYMSRLDADWEDRIIIIMTTKTIRSEMRGRMGFGKRAA